MKQSLIQLLRRLSESHGGAAAEGQVRECLRAELQNRGTADKTGNLSFYKPGRSKHPLVMLTAHMDEVGLAVQSITKDGYIRFLPMGGFWKPVLPAQRFKLLTRTGTEITGVIATKPVHMLSKSEKQNTPEINDMFLDIGATSAGQARSEFGVRLGDPIVPDVDFAQTRNPDLFVGKAFDDRAGLAVGTEVFKRLGNTHPNTVCLAATVQEEVGGRGAQTACAKIKPDVALVLEGAPADDFPGAAPDNCQGALGKGAQIRVMDPTTVMNPDLVELLINTAEECDIPYQTAVRRSGGTDAKKIHVAGEGVPCVVLSVPARYIHTPHCMVNITDCLSAVKLIEKVVQKLDSETVASLTAY